MTKIKVISQKPPKNWIFGKNGHFLTLFDQKNPQFWIFPQVQLLTHASRHLGEDFRKFSAKINDNKPRAIRSDGEYKFEFYCLTTDLL